MSGRPESGAPAVGAPIGEAAARDLLLRDSVALMAGAPAAPSAEERERRERTARLQAWIARQEWRELPRGWLVWPALDGRYRFFVDRVPGNAGAVYVVGGDMREPSRREEWWVEPAPRVRA